MTLNGQNDRWTLLEGLIPADTRPEELKNEVLSVIADRLEDALADHSRGQMDCLARELNSLFGELVQRAPKSVLDTIRNSKDAPQDTHAAFMIGQVGFAQHFAAHVAHKRADDAFVQTVLSKANSQIIAELLKGEQTQKDLARNLGCREETVSRKIKPLRELGAVDYRREGVSFYNFLTPATKSIPDLEALVSSDATKLPSVEIYLNKVRDGLEPHMQGAQTMVPPQLLPQHRAH